MSLPQCVRRPPRSEASSRLGDAFHDTEAMSLRQFQSVIRPTNSDALSEHRPTIGSISRHPSHSEAHLHALTCFKLECALKGFLPSYEATFMHVK